MIEIVILISFKKKMSLILIVYIFTAVFLSAPRNDQIMSFTRSQTKVYDYLRVGAAQTNITPPLLWKFQTEGAVTSSPALVDVDKDGTLDVIFASGNRKLYAVNYYGIFRQVV